MPLLGAPESISVVRFVISVVLVLLHLFLLIVLQLLVLSVRVLLAISINIVPNVKWLLPWLLWSRSEGYSSYGS